MRRGVHSVQRLTGWLRRANADDRLDPHVEIRATTKDANGLPEEITVVHSDFPPGLVPHSKPCDYCGDRQGRVVFIDLTFYVCDECARDMVDVYKGGQTTVVGGLIGLLRRSDRPDPSAEIRAYVIDADSSKREVELARSDLPPGLAPRWKACDSCSEYRMGRLVIVEVAVYCDECVAVLDDEERLEKLTALFDDRM